VVVRAFDHGGSFSLSLALARIQPVSTMHSLG
jgi:hypothetical protein